MASDPNSKHTTTGYPAAAQPPPPPPPPPFTGISYPYAAAPPPPQPQPSYYYSQPYSNYSGNGSGGSYLLRRFLLIAVAAFFLMGVATLIVWLVLRPRSPQFSVSSLSVSGFNLSSNSISASFDLGLLAENPNSKMSIDYSRVFASVHYDSYSLAETFVPPFSQSRRNSTSIFARMAALGEYMDPSQASSLKADRSDGNVEFNVRMSAVARFRSGGWRTRNRHVTVFCGAVRVMFDGNSSAGSVTGPAKSCRVYM